MIKIESELIKFKKVLVFHFILRTIDKSTCNQTPTSSTLLGNFVDVSGYQDHGMVHHVVKLLCRYSHNISFLPWSKLVTTPAPSTVKNLILYTRCFTTNEKHILNVNKVRNSFSLINFKSNLIYLSYFNNESNLNALKVY